MLVGFVLTVVKTVLLEHTVTNVRNLHHHISVILSFSHDEKSPTVFKIKRYVYYSLIIKRVTPVRMVKTVLSNVLQIAMEHVDT